MYVLFIFLKIYGLVFYYVIILCYVMLLLLMNVLYKYEKVYFCNVLLISIYFILIYRYLKYGFYGLIVIDGSVLL